MKHWTLAALAAAWSSSAFAQMPMHQHERPGTVPAAAPASVPKYESAFEGYRRHADEKLRSWSGANDEAAAIGGHMGQWRGEGPRQSEGAPSAPAPMAPGMKHDPKHGMGGRK